MKRIIDYGIVVNSDIDALIKEVSSLIKEGWQPFGSITIEYKETYLKTVYHQVMIKEAQCQTQ